MNSLHNPVRRQFLKSSSLAAAAMALNSRGFGKTSVNLNVRDFGAKGDGVTKDTLALQQAIDRCWVLGGGEVLVPAGNYLTGALALRSNTLLRLDKDSTITGSPDLADYPVSQVRWEGKWIPGHVGLLYAFDASHIGVVGPGKIVGSKAVGGRPTPQSPRRHPSIIEPIGCRNLRFEDFTVDQQGLMWCLHATYCEDVQYRNLTIRSVTGNGDGIDIDSCKRVRIEHCDIATGDDCIAIKSGRGAEAFALLNTTEDVLIADCTLADSIFACIGIGSETSGGIRNVRIERCRFTAARTHAIYIKSRPGRGAFIEDISANDLDVSGMTAGFLRINILNSGLQDQDPVPGNDGIPTTKNFRFSNVRVVDCPVLVDAVSIPPEKPLDGFTLTNVTGTARAGIQLANVKNASVRDIRVTGIAGPLIGVHNVTGTGLEGAAQIEGPKAVDPVAAPAQPYSLH